MINQSSQKLPSPVLLIGLIIILLIGIPAAGYYYYTGYKKQYTEEVKRSITAIGELKIYGITQWQKERLADASIIYKNFSFSENIKNYLLYPGDTRHKKYLMDWMEQLQKMYEYDRVSYIDGNNHERLSIPNNEDIISPLSLQNSSLAVKTRSIVFQDFYIHATTKKIYLKYFVPILDPADTTRVLGTLSIRIDPQKYLYPFISNWQLPWRTEETLLLRREGDSIVYLNNLRFRQQAALNLRISIRNESVPGVKAALGQKGIVEGIDYRGVPVFAYINSIPHSPWFLVARIDKEEIYQPLYERMWLTVVIVAILILGTSLGIGLVWRNQRMSFYKERYESAKKLNESKERFRTIFEEAPLGVALIDLLTGRIYEVNQQFAKITGRTKEEMVTIDWMSITHPDDVQEELDNMALLNAGKIHGFNMNKRYLHPDGSYVWIHMIVAPMTIEDKNHPRHLCMIEDITERKKSQEKVARLASIVESSDEFIIGKTLEGIVTSWNKGAEKIYGYTESEMVGKSISLLAPPDHKDEIKMILEKIRSGEHIEHFETVRKRKDGQRINISLTVSSIRDAAGKIIGASTIGGDITERKRVEQGLRESEERFTASFHASPNLIAITRIEDGTIVEVNEGYSQMLGYSRAESVGKSTAELSIWADPDDRATFITSLKEYGQINNFETTLRRKDGTLITVIDSARTINLKGETCVLSIVLDITDRKRAEDALREASSYNRSLIEASIDPLVTIGPDGKITDVNEATETVTGVPRERLIGDNFSNYFTEPKKANDGYQKVLAEGFVKDYPLTIRHMSGKTTDVLYNATVYKNQAGEVAGVFAAARDITERKRILDELMANEARLKEAQRLAHTGNWSLDLRTNELKWSDEIYRIFNLEPQSFGATYEVFLDAIHPDDRKIVSQAYELSVANHTGYSIEHRLLMKDGDIKYVHEQCETFYDQEGHPLRSTGTVQDITERKLAEEEIKKLNAELEQRVIQRTAQLEAVNKELEAFSYSVSHDLRAPLRHVSGYVDLLNKHFHDAPPEKRNHYLNTISDSARQMGTLIDDLLQFSRTGRLEMTVADVDMNVVVNDVIKSLHQECANRTIEWVVGSLPTLMCDKALLKLVWVNLLDNAVKFTKVKEKVRIEIGFRDEDKESILFVRDNGAGFDMQYAQKLFGVFQRLHSKAEFEGTGIGLANVRRIILRHGGRTWAEAEPNNGATFYFTIPKKKENAS